MMRGWLLALALCALPCVASAQNVVGPLQAQNQLSELARTAAAARANLAAAAQADLLSEVSRAQGAEATNAAVAAATASALTAETTRAQGAEGTIAGQILAPLSYDAFGDSITAGCCGTPNYVQNLGAALGLTPTNHGVTGYQAEDGTSLIYGFNVSGTARQLISYMIGTNDAAFWVNANPELSYAAIMAAQIGWLALPESAKTRGQSSAVVYSGTWTNNPAWGGSVGKQSATNGSTATLSLYGSTLYLAYYVATGNGGTFTVSVDGVQIGGTYLATGFNNSTVSTNGSSQGSFLLRVPNLSMAQHTVVLTVTSATGAGNIVGLDWAAGIPAPNQQGGPRVLVSAPPRQQSPASDANLQIFAALNKAAAVQAATDGLNVRFIDPGVYINQGTDFTSPEAVHPNTLGHAHVAQAFIDRLFTAFGSPSEEQAAAAASLASVLSVGNGGVAASTDFTANSFFSNGPSFWGKDPTAGNTGNYSIYMGASKTLSSGLIAWDNTNGRLNLGTNGKSFLAINADGSLSELGAGTAGAAFYLGDKFGGNNYASVVYDLSNDRLNVGLDGRLGFSVNTDNTVQVSNSTKTNSPAVLTIGNKWQGLNYTDLSWTNGTSTFAIAPVGVTMLSVGPTFVSLYGSSPPTSCTGLPSGTIIKGASNVATFCP